MTRKSDSSIIVHRSPLGENSRHKAIPHRNPLPHFQVTPARYLPWRYLPWGATVTTVGSRGK